MIITCIILIVLGIAAAPSIILSKKPNAKDILDKLVPFQGWLGVIICIIGIWSLIGSIMGIKVVGQAPFYWLAGLIVSLVEIVLGFIMGFNLINKYLLSHSPASEEKGLKLMAKLQPMQEKLGIAAIIIGVIALIIIFI